GSPRMRSRAPLSTPRRRRVRLACEENGNEGAVRRAACQYRKHSATPAASRAQARTADGGTGGRLGEADAKLGADRNCPLRTSLGVNRLRPGGAGRGPKTKAAVNELARQGRAVLGSTSPPGAIYLEVPEVGQP